eukprot:6294286-Amphidinium_carterae.2
MPAIPYATRNIEPSEAIGAHDAYVGTLKFLLEEVFHTPVHASMKRIEPRLTTLLLRPSSVFVSPHTSPPL